MEHIFYDMEHICYPQQRRKQFLEAAEMIAKSIFDQFDDLLRDLVWFELRAFRRDKAFLGWLAVFAIVVPFSPFGLVPIHQQAGLSAHFAIKEFHPQFRAAFGPFIEFRLGADEAVVSQELHVAGKFIGPLFHILADPPFARFHDPDQAR